MLGIFKRFLSKEDVAASVPTTAAKQPVRVTVGAATRPPLPKPVPRTPVGQQTAGTTPSRTAQPAARTHVQITLGAIESSLPESLRHKIVGALSETVSVPVEVILPQLGNGTIALGLEDLRDCAPHLFASLAGHEEIVVTLPLGEIVKQIDPSVFQRRPAQRRINVPDEVLSVFTQTATGATIVVPPPAVSAPAPHPRPTPKSNTGTTSVAPTRIAMPSAPAPAIKPTAALPLAEAPSPSRISLSPQAAAELSAATAPQPKLPAQSQQSAVNLKPRPASAKPLKQAEAAPGEKLAVPLHKVIAAWPEEVRQEVGDLDANTAEVLVPVELVEPGLRTGKVFFSWNEVAAWMNPPLPRQPSRSAGEIPVELPLKVMAPIFMAHHRGATGHKKADVGEGIPDVFHSAAAPRNSSAGVAVEEQPVRSPQLQMRSSASSKSAPVAPATVELASPVPRMPVPSTPPTPLENDGPIPAPGLPPQNGSALLLDQVIGPPGGRLSAKEIVQNASRMPGAVGALLSMSDGLVVHANVPPAIKADVLAAFLPQMYGRMGQYTKELGLGQLQGIALAVEGGCWQVFKQPNIYFAVCGKTGEALPFNLLAQIAAELSNQQT